MKEAFVCHQNIWWHFFFKPLYGLCFRKKEQGRFSSFEVLFPDACEDFYVISEQDNIHQVSQDKNGSVLYLFLEDNKWQKTTLLESKSPSTYPKHFCLIPVGNFLNLFYVLFYKERHMLIHQILTGDNRPPTVIDHIKASTPPYLTALKGTDIGIYYENEAGTCGFKIFRWSRKDLGQFVPLAPGNSCTLRGILPEIGGCIRYAALQKFDKIANLVYFEKNGDEDFSEATTIYLDVSPDCHPIFCHEEEKLYLLWREKGSIMSAYSTDDGKHWSKPVRYMKGAATEPRLYHICNHGTIRQSYGYEKDGDPVFYVGAALPEKPEILKPPAPALHPEGFEAAEFAKSMGALPTAEIPDKNPMLELMQRELSRIKEQLFSLRKDVASLSERTEKLESGFIDTNSIM